MEGDKEQNHIIVQSFLRYIISLSGNYLTNDREGLISAGIIAAYDAVAKFPNREGDFTIKSYLIQYVKFAMLREITNARHIEKDWTVHRKKKLNVETVSVESNSEFDLDYTPNIEGRVELYEILDQACRDDIDRKIIQLLRNGEKESSIMLALGLKRHKGTLKIQALKNRIQYLWQL